jgi:hypothetical protein
LTYNNNQEEERSKGEKEMSEQNQTGTGKKKVIGGTGLKKKNQNPEESIKKKGSTTAKKKVVGGTGAKKKVRGGTGAKKKKRVVEKTISIGDTELTFSLKKPIKIKSKKGQVAVDSLFPTYVTFLFLTLILTAMGYAIYLDLHKAVIPSNL